LALLVPAGGVLVIESNAARGVFEPDLLFLVNSPEDFMKPSARRIIHLADVVVQNTGTAFSANPANISVDADRCVFRREATAILLAGGKSSRMGSDKRFLRLNGIPLVERSYCSLQSGFAEILVSTSDGEEVLPGVRHVRDVAPGRGPMGAVASCLAVARYERCLVTACDIPDVPPDLVGEMLRRARHHEVVVPIDPEGQCEPLFAVYSRAVLPELNRLLESGERRIRMIFDTFDTDYVPVAAGALRNLNTKSEFARYSAAERTGGIR
jgi:molybdopterin-guanine dinucleotide biosynthesis protein A